MDTNSRPILGFLDPPGPIHKSRTHPRIDLERMQVPKKDPQDDVLNRLRNSTSNMSSGKSKATENPLDDKDEEVMGGVSNRLSVRVKPSNLLTDGFVGVCPGI